jgi:hypothetical protein
MRHTFLRLLLFIFFFVILLLGDVASIVFSVGLFISIDSGRVSATNP